MQDLGLTELIQKHWGKVLGGIIGFIFALLVLNYGLLKSIFIFACIGAGLFIGWRYELGKGLDSLFNSLFSSKKKS